MKVGFLLGWPQISGGSYVIYEHASRLKGFGHELTVITKDHITLDKYSWHPAAETLDWLSLADAEKKQFDMVIATWWESPFLLHRLTAGHYVYFVQSIESRFWPTADPKDHDTRENDLGKLLCESTYSFNIPVITEARWIQEYLSAHYNHHAFLVRNGIRKDIYTSEGAAVSPSLSQGIRVLVEGPVDVFHKNVPKSIELCRQAGIDDVWLLTSSEIDSFPGVDHVFSCIPVHDTPAIYRSCDVLVKLSYIEGMFGPPLEMFHCGGTAIVYNVTGHDEYIVHGQNSYVVEKDNTDQVIFYLQQLKNDPDELNRLKAGARETAADWHDWSESSKEFAQSLETILKGKATSRSYLRKQTEMLFEQHQQRAMTQEMQVFALREKAELDFETRIDNFVQFYWHSGEGWSQERCQWLHYRSGDWVTASFELEENSTSIALRIDPSVHIGIIVLRLIRVTRCAPGGDILLLDTSEDFSGIKVDGTACYLYRNNDAVYLSYGNDPQIILPHCENIEPGICIQVTVVFREMGVRQFLREGDANCFFGKKGLFARMLYRLS